MKFLELHNPTLKRRALRELSQLLRRSNQSSGDLAEIIEPQTADLLAAGMRERGLDALLPAVTVRVYVDQEALAQQQQHYQTRLTQLDQLRKFVRAQASLSLIRALFPEFSVAEIEQVRVVMRVPAPGPAQELDPAEYLAAHRTWKELQKSTSNARDRFLGLAEAFPSHTLLTLFAALNQR